MIKNYINIFESRILTNNKLNNGQLNCPFTVFLKDEKIIYWAPKITRLNYIKLNPGAYVDTNVKFELGDKLYFKFKSQKNNNEEGDIWLFSASNFDTTINKHRKKLFAHINIYGELVLNNTKNDSTTEYNSLIGTNRFMQFDTLYELDWDFSSSSYNDYKLNNSLAWLNTSRSNISNKPNVNCDTSFLLNMSHNVNASPRITSLLVYEFKIIDINGNCKCDIIPILFDNSPMFLNTITNEYINISIKNGYNPLIEYE